MKQPTINIELFTGKTLSDGRHPIYIVVRAGGKARRKSVGSASLKEWDSKNNEIRSRSRPDFEAVNDHIFNEYTKYKAIFNALKKRPGFLPEDVFDMQVSASSPLFFANARLYLEMSKSRSVLHYESLRSRMNKLLEYTENRDFSFDEITPQWIAGYKQFCIKRGNSENTINTAFKFIKMIAKFAGQSVTIPKVPFPKPIKEKLTLEEIIRLDSLILEPDTHAWHTKNTFMLQYYFRGMRIGDLLTLRWKDISGDRLYYGTSKTNQEHSIKVVKQAALILDLYKGGGPFVLPWIRNADPDKIAMAKEIKNRTSVINWHLKELAKKAGISKNISTHIARHSFASISDKKLKGDLKAIQGMLGHSSRKQTEEYIQDLRRTDELDDAADRVFD